MNVFRVITGAVSVTMLTFSTLSAVAQTQATRSNAVGPGLVSSQSIQSDPLDERPIEIVKKSVKKIDKKLWMLSQISPTDNKSLCLSTGSVVTAIHAGYDSFATLTFERQDMAVKARGLAKEILALDNSSLSRLYGYCSSSPTLSSSLSSSEIQGIQLDLKNGVYPKLKSIVVQLIKISEL